MSSTSHKRKSSKANSLLNKAKKQRQAQFTPRQSVAAPTGAIGRFASHSRRANSDEIKTMDVPFRGAYNAVYTPDTNPAQILNLDSGTATLQAVNLCQQGVGISQRLANKIAMKSLRIRMNLTPTGNATADPTYARVMLIYDRNANGTYPATNLILSDSIQNNTVTAGLFNSNLNPNLFDRYAVLMDKLLVIPCAQATVNLTSVTPSTEHMEWDIDEFIKLKNLETQFSGTANPMTIAQVQTGALQILCMGSATAANTSWALFGTTRLRFRDV